VRPAMSRHHRSETMNSELRAVQQFLSPLSVNYPGFDLWYTDKVIAGVVSGERYACVVRDGDQITGVGIAKKDDRERKICTVRVDEVAIGRGTGVRIFDRLLRWLDTDRPHLTVPEQKLVHFDRIFEWYGFEMTSYCDGRYIERQRELAFNDTSATLVSGSKPYISSATLRTSLESASRIRSGTSSSRAYSSATWTA
jgi:hypothetical protein